MLLRTSLFSRALGHRTSLVLAGPDTWPEGPCKTVYLLHGMEGDQDTWVQQSQLLRYAAQGRTLYVMPDGGRSFYRDMAQGPGYFTYVSQELPQWVQRQFPVSPHRADTAAIGCSMGGYGALLCALGHPERFGLCAAFAPACLFAGEILSHLDAPGPPPSFAAAWARLRQQELRQAFGGPRLFSPADELLAQAGGLPLHLRPQLYLACGSRDPFLPDCQRFSAGLRQMGFAHVWAVWDGIHDYRFFDTALNRAIYHLQL